MDVSKTMRSSVARTVVCSTLLAGGVGLWLWMKRRKRQLDSDTVKLGCVNRHVIHIVSTPEEWDQCYDQLLQDTRKSKILGIDCEWVLKSPVALLQIASSSGFCVLVRLCNLGRDGIPQSLTTLLLDRSILKLGVAVNDDAKKLMRDYGLKVNGCVDLRHILKRVRGIYTCRSWGLQGLAKGVLNISLSKDFKVRCGNWEVKRLSPRQIEYAALDALVAVDIFSNLVAAKVSGSDPQLHPQSASQLTVSTFLSASRSLCQGIVDVGFVRERTGRQKGNPVHAKKRERKQNGEMYSMRSRPLWDNCELLAPDGQLLCTCDSRKAKWYISKGLGDKVSDNPVVVKLKFEPSGRPKTERNYYLHQKENMCVVCGSTEGYARKFIVPQEYRKFFPRLLKEHTSHDVLLLCPVCHRLSSDYDSALRQQLAQECEAPLNAGQNSSVLQDHFLQQVKSAARALKLNRDKIPEPRVSELERTLMDYYGVPELTPELVEESTNMDIRQARENYVNHAQQVVRHIAEHGGGLLQFQMRWRRHFVQTMNPQHLPAFWSVDYVPENWSEETVEEDTKDDDDEEQSVTQLPWQEENEEDEGEETQEENEDVEFESEDTEEEED